MRHRKRPPARASARRALWLLAGSILAASIFGCAGTRTVMVEQLDSHAVKIDLRGHRQGLFGKKVERGFGHPLTISPERMSNILGALEVEEQTGPDTTLRRVAIHPDIQDDLAKALADAYADAGPDQEILVRAVRKQMQKGIFHRKYLTSFVTYVRDDLMYIYLARIDWLIPRREEDDPLEYPDPKRRAMAFRMVSGEHVFYAGLQGVEIEWSDPVFRTAYKLPDAVSAEGPRKRTVLDQSPLPRLPQDDQTIEERIGDLSPEQLRALADLEEDRRQGRITENDYLRARRDLLRER